MGSQFDCCTSLSSLDFNEDGKGIQYFDFPKFVIKNFKSKYNSLKHIQSAAVKRSLDVYESVRRSYSIKMPESWIWPGNLLIDGYNSEGANQDTKSVHITITKTEQSMWLTFLEAYFSDLGKIGNFFVGVEAYNVVYQWCARNSSELDRFHLYLLINELLQLNSREMMIDFQDNARKNWSRSNFPNCIWNTVFEVTSISRKKNQLIARRAAYLERYYIPGHGFKTIPSLTELWFTLCIDEILEFTAIFFCNEYYALFLSDNFPLVTDLKLEVYKILKLLFVIHLEKARLRDHLKDVSQTLT